MTAGFTPRADHMPEEVFRALKRLMVEYAHGVDTRGDPEKVVACFTPDAAIDFSSVGFPVMQGEEEIRAFYTGLVENMAHEFHISANPRPDFWDGTVGAITSYVMGMGLAKDGTGISVQVKYRMECVEHEGAWRCRRFTLDAMMPMAA